MKNGENKKLIVLSGGGTMGPVTPLLAMAGKIREECEKEGINCGFLWLGTKDGPEKDFILKENMEFKAIFGGKLRRYLSFRNLTDIARIKIGFLQSLFIFIKRKPAVFISAGGFVSVPAAWAAWFLGIPVLIHQQDVRPGLANRLMAPAAKKITVTFESSIKDYGKKAELVGNSVRKEIIEYKITKREARQKIGLAQEKPTLFVIGGGTGAQAINEFVERNLHEMLKFCQIIHVTGKGKKTVNKSINAYFPFEIMHIDGLIKAYTSADVVLSRCGMGVLTELSCLGKPSILIPMPDSHQEENASIFSEKKAAVVLDQRTLTDDDFVIQIKNIILDKEKLETLAHNIKDVIVTGGDRKIAEIVVNMLRTPGK